MCWHWRLNHPCSMWEIDRAVGAHFLQATVDDPMLVGTSRPNQFQFSILRESIFCNPFLPLFVCVRPHIRSLFVDPAAEVPKSAFLPSAQWSEIVARPFCLAASCSLIRSFKRWSQRAATVDKTCFLSYIRWQPVRKYCKWIVHRRRDVSAHYARYFGRPSHETIKFTG